MDTKFIAGTAVVIAVIAAFIAQKLLSSPPSSPSTVQPTSTSLPSLLWPLLTTHIRLQPQPSRHAFKYPLLYFGVDVQDLELGWLDCGRVFGYQSEKMNKSWKFTTLREAGYLYADETIDKASSGEEVDSKMASLRSTEPLRAKLISIISTHLKIDKNSVMHKLGRVYLLTMPAFIGFEGINPLSVWLCYNGKEEEEIGLWVVVLEVHNTFGERHVYVLETGNGEDSAPIGYQHRWTFPRSFHVSPFNSRSGFYTLSLVAPFIALPGPISPVKAAAPQLSISLLLLTPEKTPKLHARLSTSGCGPPIPITSRSVLSTILGKYPISLLLTTPRILWNAGVLSLSKKLPVYSRPDPIGREEATVWREGKGKESSLDGFEDGGDWGVVDKKAAVRGGIGWKKASSGELKCQQWIQEYIKRILLTASASNGSRSGLPNEVLIIPSDPGRPMVLITADAIVSITTLDHTNTLPSISTLKITAISNQTFQLLALSPTPKHSLLLSAPPLNAFLVSSREQFIALFSPDIKDTTLSQPTSTLSTSVTRFIRRLNTFIHPALRQQQHFLEPAPPGLPLVLGLFLILEWMEYAVMGLLGVRFVRGGAGWKEVWLSASSR